METPLICANIGKWDLLLKHSLFQDPQLGNSLIQKDCCEKGICENNCYFKISKDLIIDSGQDNFIIEQTVGGGALGSLALKSGPRHLFPPRHLLFPWPCNAVHVIMSSPVQKE